MLKGSGIRENFIEVRSTAERWDEETVQKCIDAVEDVTHGVVAVLCDKHVDKIGEVLVAYGVFEGSMDSDTGTVLHSRYRHLKRGDRVAFLPMHGIRCHSDNYSWVPEGCEIRFYGIACPVNDSLVILEE